MSLYWPADPTNVPASPHLHAFIVGVGDYYHLGLGATRPATFLSGLAPLTTTPLSAKRMARWLETKYQNSSCPLGSIELLLSPGENLKRADGSEVAIEAATMSNINARFAQWFKRCNSDKKNTAFFYFAGHGLSTVTQFLLPADFGDPDLPNEWENCIDFSGTQVGMAKCAAQTQIYFIDACRDEPFEALMQRNPSGKSLANSKFGDKVDLSAAYYAASEGRQAFGRDGEETFFCKALIMCLDGAGARKPGPKWQVDAASLSTGLVSVIEIMGAIENLALSSDCRMQKPVPLHFPVDGAVVVKVNCEPSKVNAQAAIEVRRGSDVLSSPAGQSRPWMGCIGAGNVTVQVDCPNLPRYFMQDLMSPPTYAVDVMF